METRSPSPIVETSGFLVSVWFPGFRPGFLVSALVSWFPLWFPGFRFGSQVSALLAFLVSVPPAMMCQLQDTPFFELSKSVFDQIRSVSDQISFQIRSVFRSDQISLAHLPSRGIQFSRGEGGRRRRCFVNVKVVLAPKFREGSAGSAGLN